MVETHNTYKNIKIDNLLNLNYREDDFFDLESFSMIKNVETETQTSSTNSTKFSDLRFESANQKEIETEALNKLFNAVLDVVSVKKFNKKKCSFNDKAIFLNSDPLLFGTSSEIDYDFVQSVPELPFSNQLNEFRISSAEDHNNVIQIIKNNELENERKDYDYQQFLDFEYPINYSPMLLDNKSTNECFENDSNAHIVQNSQDKEFLTFYQKKKSIKKSIMSKINVKLNDLVDKKEKIMVSLFENILNTTFDHFLKFIVSIKKKQYYNYSIDLKAKDYLKSHNYLLNFFYSNSKLDNNVNKFRYNAFQDLLELENLKSHDYMRKIRSDFLKSIIVTISQEKGVKNRNLTLPSIQQYGLLLKFFGKLGCKDIVFWVWNHLMLFSVYVPEDVVCGCILDALVNCNDLSTSHKLLNSMKDYHHLKLNTIMYSIVIKGCTKAKRIQEGLDLLREMIESNIKPNKVTYNTLINACALCGSVDEAKNLVDEMSENGLKPDLVTFSTLLKGYCIKGEIMIAYNLVNELKKKNFPRDGILYNTLLDGCVVNGEFELCEKVWEEFKQDDIKPSNFTLSIFIKLLGKLNKMEKIFVMLKEFPQKYNFLPNAHVYTCVISACMVNSHFDNILEIVNSLLKVTRGVLDFRSLKTTLDALYQSKNYIEGIELLKLQLNLPNKLYNVDLQEKPKKSIKISKQILNSWRSIVLSSLDVPNKLKEIFHQK